MLRDLRIVALFLAGTATPLYSIGPDARDDVLPTVVESFAARQTMVVFEFKRWQESLLVLKTRLERSEQRADRAAAQLLYKLWDHSRRQWYRQDAESIVRTLSRQPIRLKDLSDAAAAIHDIQNATENSINAFLDAFDSGNGSLEVLNAWRKSVQALTQLQVQALDASAQISATAASRRLFATIKGDVLIPDKYHASLARKLNEFIQRQMEVEGAFVNDDATITQVPFAVRTSLELERAFAKSGGLTLRNAQINAVLALAEFRNELGIARQELEDLIRARRRSQSCRELPMLSRQLQKLRQIYVAQAIESSREQDDEPDYTSRFPEIREQLRQHQIKRVAQMHQHNLQWIRSWSHELEHVAQHIKALPNLMMAVNANVLLDANSLVRIAEDLNSVADRLRSNTFNSRVLQDLDAAIVRLEEEVRRLPISLPAQRGLGDPLSKQARQDLNQCISRYYSILKFQRESQSDMQKHLDRKAAEMIRAILNEPQLDRKP